MRIKDTGFFLSPYSQIKEKGSTAQTEAAAKNSNKAFQNNMSRAVRSDRIELSSLPEESPDQLIRNLKDGICEELGRDTGSARLQYLTAAVGSGSYAVDSGTLAKILLSDE